MPDYIKVILLIFVLLVGCGDIDRDNSARLEGTVRLDDGGDGDLEGIQVFLPGTPWNILTDKKGAFRLPKIEPGEYELVVKHPGYEIFRRDVKIPPGGKISLMPISLKPDYTTGKAGDIEGIVRLDKAASYDGVLVFIQGTDFIQYTDSTGQFFFEDVLEGEYSLSIHCRGYGDIKNYSVTVTGGEVTHIPPIILEFSGDSSEKKSQGKMEGYVFLDGVEKHDGTLVNLKNTNYFSMTDSDGFYQFKDIPLEDYSLVATHDGYKTREFGPVSVLSGTSTLVDPVSLDPDVLVHTNGIIKGKVFYSDRDDHTGIIVNVRGTSVQTLTMNDGVYQLNEIPVGSYSLLFSADGYSSIDLLGVQVSSGNITDAPDIVLMRSENPNAVHGEIQGTATLKGKEDHSGITVALAGTSGVALTNSKGEYRITQVEPGEYELIVSKDGYEDNGMAVKLLSGGSTSLPPIELVPIANPPYVVSTNPMDNETRVPVEETVDISVEFDRFMRGDTIKKGIKISPPVNMKTFFGKDSKESEYNVLQIKLFRTGKNAVSFETEYTVTIPETAADLDGNTMEEPYEFSFTTGGARILRTVPVDGDNNVLPTVFDKPQIVVYFNAHIDMASFRGALSIKPNVDWQPIFHRFSSNPLGDEVAIQVGLKEDTKYTFSVDRRLRTSEGARFDNTPYTWGFRVGSLDDLPTVDIGELPDD